jgi:hypothetical protein
MSDWDPLDMIFRYHTQPGDTERGNYWETARAFASIYGAGTYDIVEQLAFLRVVGTPETLKEERERVLYALNVVERAVRDQQQRGHLRPGFYSYEYGEYFDAPETSGLDMVEGLRELGRYLEAAYLESRRIMESLEADGFTYNENKGRLEVKPEGRGSRRKVVSEVVARLHERHRDDDEWYSKGRYARFRSTLSEVFPEDLLTDDAIKSAIQYQERRRAGD